MNTVKKLFKCLLLLFFTSHVLNAQVISFDMESSNFAGSGVAGYAEGPAATAQFFSPMGLTVDASGNVYVADNINRSIVRKISTAGIVSTVAGIGGQGYTDGLASQAKFYMPSDVIALNNGVIYIADNGNLQIRRVAPGVLVTTVAGKDGLVGYVDGIVPNARFGQLYSLVMDAAGNLYVTDETNHAIRKITPTGVVTTVAGGAGVGYADGNGGAAQFDLPMGIAIDAAGNLIVADSYNHCIRKITPAGDVTTVAGIGGTSGFKDGLAATAKFNRPEGVAVDKAGNIYVADRSNSRIRKITPSGYVITIAGGYSTTYTEGIGSLAGYYNPADVALDAAENIYVTDKFHDRIRKISASKLNMYNTTAGYASAVQFVGISGAGLTGDITVSAPAGFEISTNASTGFSSSLTLTPSSGDISTTKVYVRVSSLASAGSYSDSLEINSPGALMQRFSVKATIVPNNSAPTIMPAMRFSSVSGSGAYGYLDGSASVAMFGNVGDMVMDASGNIYVADNWNHRIRKVTPDGTVSTFAGSGVAGFADGIGVAAQFNYPKGITIDNAGVIYVADASNNRIRKITSDGTVTTFAGSGVAGAANGIGTAAQFKYPTSIAADLYGNLFVADFSNNKIRKITSDGTVSDFGGTGYNGPSGIAVDINGNVYVADQTSRKIRKITPSGVMTTLAGAGTNGALDGLPTTAQFGSPWDITVDPSGNVYVTDGNNNNIRRITQTGVVTTLGASTNATSGFLDGINTEALLYYPTGLCMDVTGNMYVFDNNRIRKISAFTFDPFAAIAGTPSYEQKYSVVAANLSTDLTVTAPLGFEISLTNSIFSASVNISPVAGNIRTSIYVRIAASASAGSYSSNLILSSIGAVPVEISVNGNVDVLPATVYFERTVSVKAGAAGGGNVDGDVSVAKFNGVRSAVVNKDGTIYITDITNGTIRAISKSGNVTTLATGFNSPWHIAIDDAGNLYVCDRSNYRLKKITPSGVVTVLAGNSLPGSTNGTGTGARLNYPTGVAVDKLGNIYVTEDHAIRKITPSGVVTTFTGTATAGYKNGPLGVATFFYPRDIVCDKYGNLFVTDNGNHCIRKISVDGIVSTVAGKISLTSARTYGSADGSTLNATFFNPDGLAIDSNGVLYVGDYNNNKIRQIANGYVTTLAGTGIAGSLDGLALSATFNAPNGIAIDTMGNLFICDEKSNRLRTLSLPQLVPFTANAGTPSAAQSFKVNGKGLQGDLIVTAPAGFEVSLSAASGFTSSVSIAAVSGAALNKVVYIRVSASASAGNHYEKVILSSANALTQLMPIKSAVSGSQTITFGTLPVKTYLDPAFTITTATASSGLPVTVFTSSNPAVATISGTTVTIVGAGTTTITASQAGNSLYQAAADVSQVLTVKKADQIITFAPIPDVAYRYPSISYTPTVSSSSGLPIILTSSDAIVSSVSGNSLVLKNVGTTTITATQAGNTNYNSATVTQTLTITKASQTITFDPIPTKVYSSGAIFALPGYTSAGLFITYTSSNPAVATVSANTVTLVGSGTTEITATQSGNANFTAAASVTQTLTVTAAVQYIFFSLDPYTFGDPDLTLTEFATSSLPITYTSSNPNVATIVGNTVTIVGAGNSLITASQAGDYRWLAAQPVSRSLIVNKANQTITFDALADRSISDGSLTLAGVSSSDLDVVYASSNPAVAIVSGNVLTVIGAGSTTITASQPGNSNYNAALDIVRQLTVTKGVQTITFDALTEKLVGDDDFTLIQNTSAGLEITYTSSNPAVATISGNTVTIVGAGTSVITASQAGNSIYMPALEVTHVLTVGTTTAILHKTNAVASVYPNPATDYFMIEIPYLQSGEQVNVTFTNPLGMTVFEKQFESGIADIKMDTKDIAKGAYLLIIETDTKFEVKKIIIQ
jgi:Gluconolactonase